MECKHHNTCLNIIFDLFGVLVTTEWESVVTQILCSDKELTPLFMLFLNQKIGQTTKKGCSILVNWKHFCRHSFLAIFYKN